jgi:hypothetical protein
VDVELSVGRTDGLSEGDVWAWADANVAAPSSRIVVGRADFVSTDVREVHSGRAYQMDIVPDEPPVRHAILIGWPPADESLRKNIAQRLAAAASQVIR